MAIGKPVKPEIKAKIIAEKLKNPKVHASEIAKKILTEDQIQLRVENVQRIIERYLGKQLSNVDQVKEIINQDLRTILAGTSIANLKLADTLQKIMKGEFTQVDLAKLASILSDATKRHQLLTGGATENLAVAAKTYLPEKEPE